jgi:hypothetical protein
MRNREHHMGLPLIGLLLAAVSVTVGACSPFRGFPVVQPGTPQDEKDAVICTALTRAAVDNKDVPDYYLLVKSPGIVVRSETRYNSVPDSIGSTSLPQSHDVRFILMTLPQIQAVADSHEDFVYLCIPAVKINADEARVAVETRWAKGKKSRRLYVSGGGYTLKCVKTNGSWDIQKVLGAWVE